MKKLKVGYCWYPQAPYSDIRLIVDKCTDLGVTYKLCDIRKTMRYIKNAIKGKIERKIFRKESSRGWDKSSIYAPLFMPNVDIIHTFSSVCNVKCKWLTTFESVVPRTDLTIIKKDTRSNSDNLDKLTKKELALMEKENCLALIALSESAQRIQEKMLLDFGYSKESPLFKKMMVIHPPQEILISNEELEHKFYSVNVPEFIFVGKAFFRKGGAELVNVLSEFADNEKFHLTIVSSLLFKGFNKNITEIEQKHYKEILLKTPWITWYESLPNKEVLELCKKSHIGFLPSYVDTYGYSVLEMQAAGCAVVSTDVRAFTEINNSECGYLVHLKHDDLGKDAFLITEQDFIERKKECEDGLRACMKEIFASVKKDGGGGYIQRQRILFPEFKKITIRRNMQKNCIRFIVKEKCSEPKSFDNRACS